eukprot:4259834-Prymnesium_polylepis.1
MSRMSIIGKVTRSEMAIWPSSLRNAGMPRARCSSRSSRKTLIAAKMFVRADAAASSTISSSERKTLIPSKMLSGERQ